MNRVLGLIALIGFSMSAVAHAAALAGVDVSARWPAVWLLHVGIFVVFVPFVISSRRNGRPSTKDVLTLLPSWASAMVVVLFIYALVNFGLFMLRTEGGNPAVDHGRFVLKSHGHLIREITSTEYAAFRANEIRGFSGHWLLFYF